MKKIVLIFILILIYGCTENSNKKSTQGTDALIINLKTDGSEFFNSQKIILGADLENKGNYDISQLKLYLHGYDPSVLPFEQKILPVLPLAGKSDLNYGSNTYAEWETIVKMPSKSDKITQDITLTACYKYQTIATPEICIDPNRYEYGGNTRCPFDIRGLENSQGAPIVITGIQQKTTNEKVYLKISFENKGKGDIFTKSLENCHSDLSLRDINTLNVKKVALSSEEFKCEPSNPIRLSNNKGYIICEYPLKGNNFYVSPLTIILEYNYRQTASKSITLVNVN